MNVLYFRSFNINGMILFIFTGLHSLIQLHHINDMFYFMESSLVTLGHFYSIGLQCYFVRNISSKHVMFFPCFLSSCFTTVLLPIFV